MSTPSEKLHYRKQQSQRELIKANTSDALVKHQTLGATMAEHNMMTDAFRVKKKRDRFNGLSEDHVKAKLLPDHLDYGLDIIIIGINPGLTAAHVGHHYAGPGNHFWKCLFLSGFTPEQMNAFDDFKLKTIGIGFTNIVARTTRGSADLTRTEIKEGAKTLCAKVQQYRPKIAVFNGKGIYEVFCGHKNFSFGKQPEPFPGTNTVIFVMPSSSARCAQLPRAVDKVRFYVALRKLRDHLSGTLPHLDESEVVFLDLQLKVESKQEPDHGEETVKREPLRRRRNAKNSVELTPSPTKKTDSSIWTAGQWMEKSSISDLGGLGECSNYVLGINNASGRSSHRNFCTESSIPLTFATTSTGTRLSCSAPYQCSSSLPHQCEMKPPQIGETFDCIKSESLQDSLEYGIMPFAQR